ncbi:hypothetical protein Q4519_21520 [Motilimonas sp. 1_MG-2023]|uniref:hypothetical protein n=1 Tax=Motilimonas sp. 1_MG-2023 TaxID=3062672 RepID=UPI0026E3F61B|nr:hypothetical protein [Motilimonas sp. 1_MG-2023]MDO6528238.1 hypothetical protein [Motilimonas sp. 1_MG-2023]
MDRIYSIRHFGLFSKPFLTIKNNGFIYRDNLYTHDDIKAIRTSGGRGQPLRMGVQLNDGKLILINAAALELSGVKAKTGFFSGNNVVFEELREYFESPHT